MDIISFLIFLIWLACGYLVVRFVLRTGGHTPIGHVAHWFGGVFTMIGLAIGMAWIFSQLDHAFGARVNAYVLTHQISSQDVRPLIERHATDQRVTLYRPGSINPQVSVDGTQLVIDEQQTIHTSLWWMLWDTKFSR